MAPVEQPRANRRTRINRPRVLTAIAGGARVEDVARDLNIAPKRVEKFLSEELRRRWIAPAQDHARLQIARLEAIAAQLKVKAGEGHLPTIDRLLRVLDRLDRYHGYSRLAASVDSIGSDDLRGDLLVKMNHATRALPGADE